MSGMGEFDGPRPGSTMRFTAQVVDQFFRRPLRYLLPVALFFGLGLVTASRQVDEYLSQGALTASSNPLVEPTEIRTTDLGRSESPAAGTARLISEQLGTDAFIDEIATRAGLSEALDSGGLEHEAIRRRIAASDQGVSVLIVTSTWDDPQTAFLLVESTIEAYLAYVDDIVTGDSADAVEFLESQLRDAEDRSRTASSELEEFVSVLPPLIGALERPTEVQLQLNRLSDSVQESTALVSEVQRQIDQAKLTVEQVKSSAGRQLRMVDVPEPALTPESSTVARLVTIVGFTTMGALIALAALVLAAILDRSVRSQRQLSLVTGSDVVVAVPRLRELHRRPRRLLGRRTTKKAA